MTDKQQADIVKSLRAACAFRRLDLVKGTPEKYPGTRVCVPILDLEALLADVSAGTGLTEWDAEREGNKLILLFEGYLYGDTAVGESMVVAAIHRFRTKQPIELNPDWQAAS